MSEKQFYLQIAEELKTKNVDVALWMQAKVAADGDPDKTEATYIRLRLLDLKKSLATTASSLQFVAETETKLLDTRTSELITLRSKLAQKLSAQGKPSLYSILHLQPDASDAEIASAIADFESKNLAGLGINAAEFKYAKDTLGNTALRERYDRQLLESVVDAPSSFRQYTAAQVSDEYSWRESRKTSVIIGVLSVILFGYLGLNFLKEHHSSEIQKESVNVVKDVLHSTTDTEQMKVQADIDLQNKALSLAEERQKQDLAMRARVADQMLDQQRVMQESRAQAEQQRQKAQKDQAENMRIAREKQYYACLNQQLTAQVSQRDLSSFDASARCAMFR